MDDGSQGAFVFLYRKSNLLIESFSKNSHGSASGHGRLEKLSISSEDEMIGAALRRRLFDRNEGHHVPHMYKERDAYLAWRKAYTDDRGVDSDKVFQKNSISFDVKLFEGRIEFQVYEEKRAVWTPFVVLPIDAPDRAMGEAIKLICTHLLTQDAMNK